jgi:hypothetical protein
MAYSLGITSGVINAGVVLGMVVPISCAPGETLTVIADEPRDYSFGSVQSLLQNDQITCSRGGELAFDDQGVVTPAVRTEKIYSNSNLTIGCTTLNCTASGSVMSFNLLGGSYYITSYGIFTFRIVQSSPEDITATEFNSTVVISPINLNNTTDSALSVVDVFKVFKESVTVDSVMSVTTESADAFVVKSGLDVVALSVSTLIDNTVTITNLDVTSINSGVAGSIYYVDSLNVLTELGKPSVDSLLKNDNAGIPTWQAIIAPSTGQIFYNPLSGTAPTTSTTLTSTGIYYPVNLTGSSFSSNNMTDFTIVAGVIRYTGTVTKKFKIEAVVSILPDTNDRDIRLVFGKSNSVYPTAVSLVISASYASYSAKDGTPNQSSVCLQFIDEMATNQYMQLGISTITAGHVIDVTAYTLNIVEIR